MPHPYDEYADIGFGQWAALGIKLGGREVIDQALRDEIKFVRKGNEIVVVETKPLAPVTTSSVFSATKVSETVDTATFHVKITRGNWTPQQLLDSTNRIKNTNASVVIIMPLIFNMDGVIEEFDYVMYTFDRRTSDAQIEPDRTKRQFIRDLEVQVLLNREFPEFADQHPNGDSWQDAAGNWCVVRFYRDGGGRRVFVKRRASDWIESLWFGGRKS